MITYECAARWAAPALLVATLAACSSSGGASAAAHSSAAATPSAKYLAGLHQLHGAAGGQGETFDELNSMSDDDLLRYGRTACSYLNHPSDHPYGPANDMIRGGQISEALTAAAIAKAAKLFLCPAAPGSLTGQ